LSFVDFRHSNYGAVKCQCRHYKQAICEPYKCAISDARQSLRCWEKIHKEENGSKPYAYFRLLSSVFAYK